MFDALINGRIDTFGLKFEVEYHDIEKLNTDAIDLASADISKISCAILPKISESYSLLDSGAALGRGNGPLLVRRGGYCGEIKDVLVPGVNTTASALMTRLYPSVNQRPMLFSQIARSVERGEAEAGVLIHEGRFLYAEQNLELVADLGLLWEEKMALPLPLGAIVMRSSIDAELRSKFEALLRQSIEYAFANPEVSRGFIKEHAQEMDDKVIDSHIALFVNDFSLTLGDEGAHAVKALTEC